METTCNLRSFPVCPPGGNDLKNKVISSYGTGGNHLKIKVIAIAPFSGNNHKIKVISSMRKWVEITLKLRSFPGVEMTCNTNVLKTSVSTCGVIAGESSRAVAQHDDSFPATQ